MDEGKYATLYNCPQRTAAKHDSRPAYAVPALAGRTYHPDGWEISWAQTLRDVEAKRHIAVDADTGAIKWHYQHTSNDPYDYDSVSENTIVDTIINGKQRKRLLGFTGPPFGIRHAGRGTRAALLLAGRGYPLRRPVSGRPRLREAGQVPLADFALTYRPGAGSIGR